MSANSGGSFATILLALPLTAIALMGVFGVPQFSSVIASPHEHEEEMIRRPQDFHGDSDAPRFGEFDERRGNPDERRDNPFNAGEPRPFPSEDRSAPNANSYANARETSNNSSLGQSTSWGNSTPNERTGLTPTEAPGGDWTHPSPPNSPSASNSGLDWRTASRRLTEMGVDRYHLERGATPDAFLFVCLVSPADNPQVTHRFEAEHVDPLQAVGSVLGQVDHWLQQRYAQRTFPGNGGSYTSTR